MEVFGYTLCIWLHSINISYMEFNMTGISLIIFLGIFLSTCLREESALRGALWGEEAPDITKSSEEQ